MSCNIQEYKNKFQQPIVKAYYDVEKLLDLEKKLASCTNQDESLLIKKKIDELQEVIDSDISDGKVYRGYIMDEYQRQKNGTCGHAEALGAKCETCTSQIESIQKHSDRKKWLSNIVPKSKFTVLVFYRGTWCGMCAVYLREVNHVVREIRSMGGDAYAVCSQSQQYVDEMKQETDTDYQFISDCKNVLAKKYDIKVSKKNGRAFNIMSRIIKSAIGHTNMYEPHHKDGISQPGIVVLNQKGDVVYRWCSPTHIKTGFGMFERVDPRNVLDIVQFYFSQSTHQESFLRFVSDHVGRVFELTLNDKKLRGLFTGHLKKEYAEESLEFLIDMEELKQLFEAKNLEKAKKLEEHILNNFISEQSPRSLNLSSRTRSSVIKSILQPTSFEQFEGHSFLHASKDIKDMLMRDSFQRFCTSKDFIKYAEVVIPNWFSEKNE
ncbi:Rgs4 [Acrasis kona]|uniref:Regulator of G-protein signaling n=1 Tax=Acrasis kona TaxID=1008807 RepID=A0AAW2ZGN6_9EUKA